MLWLSFLPKFHEVAVHRMLPASQAQDVDAILLGQNLAPEEQKMMVGRVRTQPASHIIIATFFTQHADGQRQGDQPPRLGFNPREDCPRVNRLFVFKGREFRVKGFVYHPNPIFLCFRMQSYGAGRPGSR